MANQATQIVWQYPKSLSPERIEWLVAVFAQNYDLHTSPQPTSDDTHSLFIKEIPGKITLRNHSQANQSQLKPWTPDSRIETDVPLTKPELPVIRGNTLSNDKYTQWSNPSEVTLGIDIFATVFALLSREEELEKGTLDAQQRFPSHRAQAFKEDFLDRPIVDEYVEVLWAYIHAIWPSIKRKRRVGQVRYSCDVDAPFDPAARSLTEFAQRVAADIIKRRNLKMPFKRAANFLQLKKGKFQQDPNYTFNFIFEAIQQSETPSVFYFLSTLSLSRGEGWYKITDPNIKALLKRITAAGHTIGLHGSFGSFQDAIQYDRELNLLAETCQTVGINQPITHNRQHYLQFNVATTPDILEASGITRDSSGGFADRAGFRFGTAIPFPMWSWQKHRALKIVQEPLICMEGSLLSAKYMHLPHIPDALDYATKLKERALAYGGDFTLLWHNNHLQTMTDKSLFKMLLRPIK